MLSYEILNSVCMGAGFHLQRSTRYSWHVWGLFHTGCSMLELNLSRTKQISFLRYFSETISSPSSPLDKGIHQSTARSGSFSIQSALFSHSAGTCWQVVSRDRRSPTDQRDGVTPSGDTQTSYLSPRSIFQAVETQSPVF